EKEESEDVELTIEQQTGNDILTNGELKEKLLEDYDPTLDLSSFKFPPVNLLDDHSTENSIVSKEELISNKNRIVETLGNYKIQIDKIKATIGPTVTLYEIVPAPGIRISKIKNLEDDIALSLSALGIRIIAPIPGRGTIGIEVPNRKPEIVSMKSMITSKKFQESDYELAIAIGKTISNETYVLDLTRMPHLLIAGATGQGKSVGLNVLITSLLYKKHPSEIKFILIDPKKVELTLYSKLERHYLAKIPGIEDAIITDIQDITNTLNSLSIEMDQRYDLLKMGHVRNIKEYNEIFKNRKLNPEKGHRFLPYIIMIIDEFADLIVTAGKGVETPLARLAQLARAVGIHLVIATQRPSINIITGTIKANFPVRIAYRVISMMDSRTILDSPGANQLVGRGDMLISPGSDLIRVQCAFVSTTEIEKITEFIGSQRGYPSAFMLPEYSDETGGDMGDIDLQKRDPFFEEAAHIVVLHQQGSTSLIQRKLSIGYNRAGRIIDQLEAAGIVGPFEGSKARHVLIPDEYSLEQYLSKIDREETPL
ncbi:MAG: DNA translocase FtsK, partial [Bacteroidales bacterium]|nr:DNA translocase FtsK [Bacteroidales bacterium]